MSAADIIVIAAATVLFAGALYLYLLAPARLRGQTAQEAMRHLLTGHYAHRGLHTPDRTVPENSLAAFRAARDAGYGVELDLRMTCDGEVVVFHDATLDRMCGVSGSIAEFSRDELADLRLHDTHEGIPLFSEVLREINGTVPLVVELKDTPGYSKLCESAAAHLDRYEGPFCVESFHPGIVRWFFQNRTDMVRGQLSAGLKEFEEQRLPVRLLLTSLLTNVATRPHFVAFNRNDARRRKTLVSGATAGGILWRLRLFRALGGVLIGWTVTHEDDHDWCIDVFDAIIFEFLNP